MITQSLAKFLIANANITAVTTEIRPQKLEDGHADPAIVYTLGSDQKQRLTDGFGSMARARFYIDCYSTSYSAVKSLAATVRGELEGFVGTLGDHQAEQIDCDGDEDLFEEDTRLHRVALRFEVFYLF